MPEPKKSKREYLAQTGGLTGARLVSDRPQRSDPGLPQDSRTVVQASPAGLDPAAQPDLVSKLIHRIKTL